MKLIFHFRDLLAFARQAVAPTTKFLFKKVSAYRAYFLRTALIGLVISVIVTALARIGYFRPYQNPLTNLLHFITQKKAQQVVLLFITEEEYKRGFHGISPLSRARLAELVNVMVKLRAKVIALDIDLSNPSPDDRELSGAIGRASAAGVPTVVIGNVRVIEDSSHSKEDSLFELRPYENERWPTTEEGFMLFEDMSPGPQWMGKVIYGGTLFRLDTDRVFRMAEGFYMIKNKDLRPKLPNLPVPSFPVAVAAAYRGISQEALMEALLNVQDDKIILSSKREGPREDIPIHFARGNRLIPNFIGNYEYFDREVNLKGLLEEYGSSKDEINTIFKDKIVIVGGTFDKKDFYQTPVGRMAGMEVLANITQSIISGNLITPTSFWKAFITEIILGIAVALIFILFSRLWATLICLVALVPAVAIASLLSFSSSHYWFDFVPTIGGVMLYGQIIEAEQVLKKIRHKLRTRREKKRRAKR